MFCDSVGYSMVQHNGKIRMVIFINVTFTTSKL